MRARISGRLHRSRSYPLIGFVVFAAACEPRQTSLSVVEQNALADSLRRKVEEAYDFSKPNVAANLMSLYADTGRVVAAAAGRVTTTRKELRDEIATFWQNVGRNMRDPKWVWDETHVDVLSRDAAVLTATYRIPHVTPAGAPHEIRGAWTAVFVRRDRDWVIVQEHLSDAPEHHVSPDTSSNE